jgi:hypothetical protein
MKPPATGTKKPGLRKGLADIRTRTAGASREQSAYRSCFVMGALELEKMRRLKERRVAAQRIVAIDQRLRQIDAEIDSLRRDLQTSRGNHSGAGPASRAPDGSFRLKY